MLLLKFITQPKRIGAVCSSSRFLARKLASYVPPNATVLEIGAGTGVITLEMIKRGLTPDRLFVCEYDPDLAYHLQTRFPHYPIFCGDACMTHTFLEPNSIDYIVSAIPLIYFSDDSKNNLITSLRKVSKPNTSMLQISYLMKSQLPQLEGERLDCVLANVPPTFIWEYRLNS